MWMKAASHVLALYWIMALTNTHLGDDSIRRTRCKRYEKGISPIAGTTHPCDNLINMASVWGSQEKPSRFTTATYF
jgi:hypothetical protein